jgi:hypothetical protein
MTTPDTTGGDVGAAVKPLRAWFAWALLGYVALVLFLVFIGWLIPEYSDFVGRSSDAATRVTQLSTIGLPLLAVLIVSQIKPALGITKLVSVIALAEYAFIILFGGLTWLIGLGNLFGDVHVSSALDYLLLAVAELILTLLAGYAVFRVFVAAGGRLQLPAGLGAPATPAPPQGDPYGAGPVA